jgi:hypothetical protein
VLPAKEHQKLSKASANSIAGVNCRKSQQANCSNEESVAWCYSKNEYPASLLEVGAKVDSGDDVRPLEGKVKRGVDFLTCTSVHG